ncbi:hypothetical protein [Histidinibacterium aquaticum]|uniref:Uncharacterized protein n=1 Tax=Histidinibacterium aquaticum TaxID=2613962 RepID=A0A5J5GGR7_9RHOB|nr:hypothetical protein [Histidinibacterium aquaticum]KAA9006952.1 hypothetical protein F3S47_14385 [Histidinibacterium aquaticum]
MLEWISNNSGPLTLIVQVLTALVWIAYLQIFITSFRRQRKSNILINRVAGNRDRAHLLVGNMGAEPINVCAFMADLCFNDGSEKRAIITEGLQDESDEEDKGVKQTRQGPLKTAEYRDLGAMGRLLDRALDEVGLPGRSDDVDTVTFTLAAEGSHDGYLVAGKQTFWVRRVDGDRAFLPQETNTIQIRKRKDRKALSKRLDQSLKDEAEQISNRATRAVKGAAEGARARTSF